MTLELTSDEARALELGHSWGLISRNRISQIADELISVQKELPSSEICELAVCSRDFQIKETLSKFFKKSEKWGPVILMLTKYIRLDALTETDLVSLYYSVSNYTDWEDGEPWYEFKIRCHEFSDARAGVFGDAEAISKELFDILSNAIENDSPLRAG